MAGEHANQDNSGSVARWAVALPASLAAHLLLGYLLIKSGVDPARMAAAAEDQPRLEIPIKLGIERSEAVTPNWLGFETPTPHVADPSPVEQSELTRAQGTEFDNLARALAAQVQATTSQALTDAQAVLDMLRAELARAAAEALKNQPKPEPKPTPAAETPPQPQSDPAQEPTEATDSEQEGSPGQQDTRSADATSLQMEMRRTQLGEVLASEGLKINTTRIRLTDLQRAMGRPPSPLVEIFFDHEGKVSKARIPDGRGTGRSDMDNALINAIYEWTAQGKRIDAMTETDPPLLVRMRILF